MKILKKLVAVGLIAVSFSFSSCETTGDPGADAKGFWNSAAVQAELVQIRDLAFNFLNTFLQNKLGSPRLSVASPDVQAAISQTVDKLQVRYPQVPRSMLVDITKSKAADMIAKAQ